MTTYSFNAITDYTTTPSMSRMEDFHSNGTRVSSARWKCRPPQTLSSLDVTVLLLSHVMFPVTAFVIYYFLFVQYGTTSVVDIYFSLFLMFTDFHGVPYRSI